MRKLVGSCLVLAGGLLVWYLRMAERRRERETLREMIAALHRMGEEIRLARTPLPELLERLEKSCRTDAATFFRKGAAMLRQGERWVPYVEELPLSSEARRCLRDMAMDLNGDEHNMCKVILLAIEELERERKKQEEQRPGEEKQLTAVCFSASAMLVILLV